MTNGTQTGDAFRQALFRVEPTQGLVEYVQEIKPYHTKILDVLVEYVYAESLNVSFKERWTWEIVLRRPDSEISYVCGYGLVWDPMLIASAPDNPTAPMTIVSAVGGVPTPDPDDLLSYSFLIEPATFTPFTVAVTDVGSNRLVFSKNYTITGIDLVNNEWLIDDPLNTLVGELTTGITPKTFFVSSNTAEYGNGSYTVTGTPTHSLGTTRVEVAEMLTPLASGDGIFHRVLEYAELPQWFSGTAVKISVTGGTLPAPLTSVDRFYFIPTPTAGYFNLAYKRFPTKFSDFVDITTLGDGTIEVIRDESVSIGASVQVKHSYLGRNDGTYVVKNVVPEGPNERVFVYQKVPYSTPPLLPADGLMTFVAAGYDEPTYCPLSQAPDLHSDVFIHETLQFNFTIDFEDSMSAGIVENETFGWGTIPYGGGVYAGVFGSPINGVERWSRTAPTSGLSPTDEAHTLLPTGIDTLMFDVGGIDETVGTVRQFYDREDV